MGDDKIKPIPVKFKAPPAEDRPMLQVVETSWIREECNHAYRWASGRHEEATYLIRDGETEVECGFCGTRLNPMFVLMRLAREETQWQRTRKAYQDEMARLNDRKRTKCESCGAMTRISRK